VEGAACCAPYKDDAERFEMLRYRSIS
jgi:hypothetical protein